MAKKLRKNAALRKKIDALATKLSTWYQDHGHPEKAAATGHIRSLASKYIDNEDLLFARLNLKYYSLRK